MATRTPARVATVLLGMDAFKRKLLLQQVFCMRSDLVFAAFFRFRFPFPDGVRYGNVVGDGRAEEVGRWRRRYGGGREPLKLRPCLEGPFGYEGSEKIIFSPPGGVLCQKLIATTGYFSVISGRIWNA